MTEYEFEDFLRRTSKLYKAVYRITEAIKEMDKLLYDSRYGMWDPDSIKEDYYYFMCELLDDDDENVYKSKHFEKCYVYYILNQEKDKVKIGVSSNPISRAKSLQTASGETIEIYHTIEFDTREEAYAAESFLHDQFDWCRKRPTKVAKSCEWFDARILDDRLMKYYDTAEKIKNDMDANARQIEQKLEKVRINV